MAELSFKRLCALFNPLVATAKDLLSATFSVEDNTKSSSHIDRLHIYVVEQVLAGHLAFVSVHELDLIYNFRSLAISFEWLNLRLFNSAKPRFARHEMVFFEIN